MTVFSAVLWILGVAAAVGGLCAIVIRSEKKKETHRYDERQRSARGDAYRVSFWVGAGYFMYVMLTLIGGTDRMIRDFSDMWAEPYLMVFFGLMLQIMTLHIYSLLTDSALPLGEKPIPSIIGYTGLGIMQLLNRPRWAEGYPGMPLMGKGSAKWVYLVSGICFLLLAAAHLISMLRHRNREE